MFIYKSTTNLDWALTNYFSLSILAVRYTSSVKNESAAKIYIWADNHLDNR